jgi:hypothetical protein
VGTTFYADRMLRQRQHARVVRYVIGLLVAASCGRAEQQSELPGSSTSGGAQAAHVVRVVSGVGYEGIVFDRHSQIDRVDGYWVPTDADIARLEGALPAYLASHPHPEAAEIAASLGTRKRQYIGVHRAGRRAIFVNLVSEALARETNWRSAPVAILDGGLANVQALYDADTGTFYELWVSGSA